MGRPTVKPEDIKESFGASVMVKVHV